MGVHFLMSAIRRQLRPIRFDMDIYFRRPVFWDDSFDVLADIDGDSWRAICLAKNDKVATEARINELEPA